MTIPGGTHPFFHHPFISQFTPIVSGKVVLDLGCGRGINGSLIKASRDISGTILIGLEANKSYIDFCKKQKVYDRIIEQHLPQIPLEDKSVDFVICSEVIEHLKRDEGLKLLKEIDRVCRGRALITTPNMFFQTLQEEIGDTHLSLWTINDFESRDYKVYGIGFKASLLWGDPLIKIKQALYFFFTPISYFFPKISGSLLAVKDFENDGRFIKLSTLQKSIKVSVVIPTYNSISTLESCIKSILGQSLKPSEVIVVDNASTDGTSDKIRQKYNEIKLVTLGNNTGVTGARNTGIRLVNKKSDYVLFFDHDMVADKNMLLELVRVAESKENAGITTPKIYYWEDKKKIWSSGTGINLWTGHVNFRSGVDKGQFNKVMEVQVAPAAILIKKNALALVKGFDDRYFATYEDTDFCFRARKIGFLTFNSPKAIAFHRLSTARKLEAERLLSRAYYVGRNKVLFMKDFGKNFYVFLIFLPLYILYYLMLTIKYGKPKQWFEFLKGTVEGLKS